VQTNYAAHYRDLWIRHWWWRARERYVLRWLDRTAPAAGGRVLNVGCGAGLLFPALARFGEVDGIEPDESIVPADSPHRSCIDHRPFDSDYATDRRYRLIVMLDVLEHIEDDVGALRRAREISEPGAVLFLTVPAMPALWSQHDEINRHYRRYARGALGDALRSAGWETMVLRYLFTWTVAPLLVRSVLYPARGSRGNGAPSYLPNVPPGVVNSSLLALSLVEQILLDRVPPPVGSSLLAVASPKGSIK